MFAHPNILEPDQLVVISRCRVVRFENLFLEFQQRTIVLRQAAALVATMAAVAPAARVPVLVRKDRREAAPDRIGVVQISACDMTSFLMLWVRAGAEE
jgi:hypothetical protein